MTDKTLNPKMLALAKSSNGTLGLITSTEKVEHTYPEGTTKFVWKGVVVAENTFIAKQGDTGAQITAKIGDLWTSSNPDVQDCDSVEQLNEIIKEIA